MTRTKYLIDCNTQRDSQQKFKAFVVGDDGEVVAWFADKRSDRAAEKCKKYLARLCSCGSGLVSEAKFDARGFFLTYACDKCERRKLSGFRPDILTNPNYDEPIDAD